MSSLFDARPAQPIFVSTRNSGVVDMEVVQELGVISVHHQLPLTLHKNPTEQQLKMLSVQLEQGRHGAIAIAQDQVRFRGGNALLGVSFTVNLNSQAGPIVVLTGTAVSIE
jgi:uncharacterized protein YbjQ (UPF0145 family)